jgi:hypothetical protein
VSTQSEAAGSVSARSLEAQGLEYFGRAKRSGNTRAFRTWILNSKEFFSRAGQLYHSTGLRGFEFRCLAWGYYLDFYLTEKPPVKVRVLEKSWRLTKQAFRLFDESANHLEFARTYDQLATVVGLVWDFHSSPRLRSQRLKEGVEFGLQSGKQISVEDNRTLLARVSARTALFIDAFGNEGSELEFNEERDKEGLELWKRAEQIDRNEALFQSGFPPGGPFHFVVEEESRRIHDEALKIARQRGDNLALGWLLSIQSGWVFFDGVRALTLAENNSTMKRSLELAEEAAATHAPARFTSPNCEVIWCVAPLPEHLLSLSWFQKDEKNRVLLLEKARRETPFLLKQARLSGYPQAPPYADHVTSKILMDLGLLEAGSRQKMKLLRLALKHRLRACRTTARIQPNHLHRNSTYLSRLGEIRGGIADLLDDRRAKIRMLARAVEDKGRSVRLAAEYTRVVSKGQPHLIGRMVGVDLIVYGDLLMRLYKVSKDDKILEKAAKAYSDAARFLKDSTAYRRLGEAYWKAAEIYDRLRANVAAAESFALAAKAYSTLVETSPDFGPIFLDYAKYLEAWSNIENARASHRRSDYETSQKFFEKAADLHQLARRWSFLAPYYTGLAKLESAENLSRVGRGNESMSAFKDAAQMFHETSLSLQKQAASLDQREEKTMVEGIALAYKEEYALARVMIEDARIAEDLGDAHTSALKFREASRLLDKAAAKTTTKHERDELLYISTLAKAWEQMAQTQTNSSDEADGFKRAALLFERAIDYGPDENANILAIGHKHFCEALAAGSKFTYSLDLTQYQTAMSSLSAASNHFASAGFRIQSKHAQACKLLLDAHARIVETGKNADSNAQARSYEEITTILNNAAENFREANLTAKQSQVLRLVARVHEELSLSQHLAEISKSIGISPTIAFPTPAQGGENPIGPSRFTGADIEARYGDSTQPDTTEDGEVVVDIAIANTGSQPIRIVHIRDLVPESAQLLGGTGFQSVEKGSILMDQKRIDPMKIETVRVRLRARKGNSIILKPRISFVDENGHAQQRSLPLRVLVSSPILEFLTQEYLYDYQVRRLGPEQCGWRTLSRVVNALKLPRSHVYGDRRWGRAYGRPLETLVRTGMVDVRRFSGERGRGGEIVKARLMHENDIAREFAETRTR